MGIYVFLAVEIASLRSQRRDGLLRDRLLVYMVLVSLCLCGEKIKSVFAAREDDAELCDNVHEHEQGCVVVQNPGGNHF